MEKVRHIAKRSLGQNFLTSPHIVSSIVSIGDVTASDVVLEIGPGKGALTKVLLESGATVYAVEKDDVLYEYLTTLFSEHIKKGMLILMKGDIIDLEKTLALPSQYKLIANIPYNITGKIIRTFLSKSLKPSVMVLMVQYEVAKRIVSTDASILSLSVAAYGTATLSRKVVAGSFFPKPSVDSAILKISNISNSLFIKNNISEEDFFNVLHAGFAHKRKKVINNLQGSYPKVFWENVFKKLSLNTNTRAEELNINEWLLLTKNVAAID